MVGAALAVGGVAFFLWQRKAAAAKVAADPTATPAARAAALAVLPQATVARVAADPTVSPAARAAAMAVLPPALQRAASETYANTARGF